MSGKHIGRMKKLENGRMNNERIIKWRNGKMEERSLKRKCKMEQRYKNDS